jgi:hypothetical protein
MDRRFHERRPASFQVRVTEISTPEVSASGQASDISESGIGIDLPLQFQPGSVVRLEINDCVLFGFVAHSTPQRTGFRTGIEVVQVLLGTSDLAQLLKATLQEAMPALQLESPGRSS